MNGVLLACVVCCVQPAGIGDVVIRELSRRPAMEAADVYKLVFQAALGSEHAVELSLAREWLAREARAIAGQAHAGEALLDTISPDGSIVRVNLRPYIARGGSLDSLAADFTETARRIRRDTTVLHAYWREITALAEAGRIPLAADSLTAYHSRMQARGYPPPPHSASYRARDRPAYRVVASEVFAARSQRTLRKPGRARRSGT